MSKSDSTYAGLVSLVIYKVPKKNHDAILQISKQSSVWNKGSLRQVDKEQGPMRKIITSLQVSVDGFIEGPNKEVDWMMVDDEEEWREINEMLNSVNALILGGGMIPNTNNTGLPS